MSSAEPDRPDSGDAATTADPQTDPGGALDEMEDRTLDASLRPSGRADDGTGSAFEVDLDPDDQGRHDAGAEQTG